MAPLPDDCAGIGCGKGGIEPTAAGAAPGADGEEERTAAPHLLQNLVPSTRVAPQELQNAISHLKEVLAQDIGASIPQIAAQAERLDPLVIGLLRKSCPLPKAELSIEGWSRPSRACVGGAFDRASAAEGSRD
ncbi:MAG: hypothetical protein ABSF59_13615 [Candidatus Sulfotelmatobacter sp.]|jgi:hypothetical protein